MGFWAEGDDSGLGGITPTHFGEQPKPNADDPAVKNKYWAGYNSEKGYFGKDTEAARAYFDDRDSDAFKARVRGDIASIGARGVPQAGKTTIGPGAYAKSATIGPMSTYGGALANFADANAVGAQQGSEMSRLAAIASGAAPGAGVRQLYASAGAADAARTAAAGSGAARLGGAAAMRGLVNAKNAAAQATAGQAQVVGAQEQQAAQSLLSGLSSSARGAAWDAAGGQAGLAQQAALWSAGQQNQAGLAQAGFDQAAALSRAGMAQKQSEMDYATQMANAEATLRAQGLDDAAIAARMGFIQDQINRDKTDRMRFWDYASGGQKWDASRAYGLDAAATLRQNQQLAAAGGLAGSMVGMFGGGDGKSSWDASSSNGGTSSSDVSNFGGG